MPRKKKAVGPAEAADLLDGIAERVARADTSFELEYEISQAMRWFVATNNLEAVKLLNLIALKYGLAGMREEEMRYDYLKKVAKGLPPLDPANEAQAVRTLAAELRAKLGR
ncbi:MAG: hypothetical protein ACJ8GN_25235 [Longimicrobiaceae bacterium]